MNKMRTLAENILKKHINETLEMKTKIHWKALHLTFFFFLSFNWQNFPPYCKANPKTSFPLGILPRLIQRKTSTHDTLIATSFNIYVGGGSKNRFIVLLM